MVIDSSIIYEVLFGKTLHEIQIRRLEMKNEVASGSLQHTQIVIQSQFGSLTEIHLPYIRDWNPSAKNRKLLPWEAFNVIGLTA